MNLSAFRPTLLATALALFVIWDHVHSTDYLTVFGQAGGAGIPAFYTKTGYGTIVAEGKDVDEVLLEEGVARRRGKRISPRGRARR